MNTERQQRQEPYEESHTGTALLTSHPPPPGLAQAPGTRPVCAPNPQAWYWGRAYC